MDRQTDRQTDDRQTDRQTDRRQTDRQTDYKVHTGQGKVRNLDLFPQGQGKVRKFGVKVREFSYSVKVREF